MSPCPCPARGTGGGLPARTVGVLKPGAPEGGTHPGGCPRPVLGRPLGAPWSLPLTPLPSAPALSSLSSFLSWSHFLWSWAFTQRGSLSTLPRGLLGPSGSDWAGGRTRILESLCRPTGGWWVVSLQDPCGRGGVRLLFFLISHPTLQRNISPTSAGPGPLGRAGAAGPPTVSTGVTGEGLKPVPMYS